MGGMGAMGMGAMGMTMPGGAEGGAFMPEGAGMAAARAVLRRIQGKNLRGPLELIF